MLSIGDAFSRQKHVVPVDGNAAAAYVGYAFTETAFGYPITPSTTAFELVEQWANKDHRKNVFGQVPTCIQLEHEGGVAGSLHGGSVAGAVASTFTSSQGLLLMLPNIIKMKHAQVPTVIHVASRSLISSIGTIECDHSDVMTVRASGANMLSSASNQDCHDLAAVAHIAAMKCQIPFLHFWDGFRTSHQITNVELLDYDEFKPLIPQKELEAIRERAFNPNHPSLRMLAIDSSFHFQADTAAAYRFRNVPQVVQETMDELAKITGRHLHLFDYHGHPEAESVIVVLGSTSQNISEAVDYCNAKGAKYGVVTVRLFRPFSPEHLAKAIPKTCKVITVLDRVNENGAFTQPLHSDICAGFMAIGDKRKILGGMFGIGGRELTPSQAAEVFKNSLSEKPRNLFRVGIVDDLMHTSLPVPEEIDMVPDGTKQCIFWGLGSDGTVGSNKESIKIICKETPLYGQGYFTYDAKKSGGLTRSHLRFGKKPITSNYAIKQADYIGVHCINFPRVYPVAKELRNGGIFVFNCPAHNAKELEKYIPKATLRQLYDKKAKVYCIDATKISIDCGIPGRINLIMQTAFFYLSGVLETNHAIKVSKASVEEQYGHSGEAVVKANIKAIDSSIDNLIKIEITQEWGQFDPTPISRFANADAPELMKKAIFPIFELKGNEMKPSDLIPITARIPRDGLGSSKYEKRGIATNIPVWDADKCIQCNTCAYSCAHAVIRPQLMKHGKGPEGVKVLQSKKFKGYDFAITVSAHDCLSCQVCIEKCPTKALSFPLATEEVVTKAAALYDKFAKLPDIDALREADPALNESLEKKKWTADGSQYYKPLLEYSGACAGCHETLYAKMLTQLFGPRLMIANATGCSIVWSGSFPSQPWTYNSRGQGPTWGNSLFEDNAEFGLGIAAAVAHRRFELKGIVERFIKSGEKCDPALMALFTEWLANYDKGEKSLPLSNSIQDILKTIPQTTGLFGEIQKRYDLFVKPSVWIVGGDGWANDIGFAGLDHVVATGADVNCLVYDNESYANTGFQTSKASPRGSVLKFAATGKDKPKKDLAGMFLQYPDVYVASCVIGANAAQTVKAMKEADEHKGTSFIDCYCPCIGHGVRPTMKNGHKQAKLAVESGYWPIFRRKPGQKVVLDNPTMKKEKLADFLKHESRYESLRKIDSKRQHDLQELLAKDIDQRWQRLQDLTK
ncbi:pyruvate-flavodoxin oxidoreductase-related family [Trichomonas vaginalis G3]|uniref:pyruvate-flavodoxin oxidoreductase-related family n=1 Tax=Trichomonas vaginalis (strain ATCC PRA-98 / G3) TaxID=412133 RepID=UPI0021E54E17|nr:pyruvate-flavodoxin oxidoreductase-related family [Trichomonas vaginalis G3]KAI5533508.1 pyruvate-flavodoxin oxidoreductase-related family [Trichomonas vaginalis G3]